MSKGLENKENESNDKCIGLNDDLTKRKLVYDYFFHEAERIAHRTDWFLIFHAILIESFVSVHDNSSDDKTNILMLIGGFGSIASYIWFMTGLRSWWILWQLGHRIETQKEIGEEHKSIFDERKGRIPSVYEWAKSAPLFSIIVPFLSLAFWIALNLIVLPISSRCFFVCGMLMLIILTTIVTQCIREPQKITKIN